MMKRLCTFLIAVCVFQAAAVAGTASEPTDYERFAGERLHYVNFAQIRNWEVVGTYEIVVRTRDQAYLLELGGRCGGYDLRYAKVIKRPSGARIQRLEIGRDLIIDDMRCPVRQIREFDYDAYSAAGGT